VSFHELSANVVDMAQLVTGLADDLSVQKRQSHQDPGAFRTRRAERWARLDQILRCCAEDPEVVQDFREISDRVVHPAPAVKDEAEQGATGPPA
jgi:hypothetical protein